jgi:hypothetical protein
VTRSLTAGTLVACIGLAWAGPIEANVVIDWNRAAVQCVQGSPTPANRPGPVGLLDMALIHAAVHDAVQAIEGRFEPYHYRNSSLRGAGSPEAAAAAAAYGMLVRLYGSANACVTPLTDPATTYAGDGGLQAGVEAAAALHPLYRPTFVSPIDPFAGGTGPGEWRPAPGGTGANTFMAYTTPFTLLRASQFRPQRQPPMQSEDYRREYDEVKALGSLTNSARTPEQTDLARFWTGNPISTWYSTLRTIIEGQAMGTADSARTLALASLAAADAQITIYDTKYHFNFWRPSTAIREGDHDGNPRTVGDPTWTPFVADPPYPDYSSGANCLAASMLTTLQLVFGTDDFDFSVASTVGGLMLNPRPYHRFSDAMQDIVDVRIYQGIHFRSADEEGRRQGARVAHWVFSKFLRPVPGS